MKIVKVKEPGGAKEQNRKFTDNIQKMAVPPKQTEGSGLKVGNKSPLNPVNMMQTAMGRKPG